MEEEQVSDHRCWDELLPDTLGLIFCKLSLQELLTVVPRVCKSWEKVVNGPYCWREIDIEDWCNGSTPENIDRMVRMLLTRSGRSLRKLYVSELHGDPIFSFIADNASSLQMLRLSRSDITDDVVEREAEKFSNITSLDLSYCCKLGARALEAMGKKCPLLSSLRRNMHPYYTESKEILSQDEEAWAIASTMRKLKQLEIAYLLVETGGVMEIIHKCGDLEFLDVRGCWDVRIEHKEIEDKFPKLKILGPHVNYWHRTHWEYLMSDCSNSLYDSDDMLFDYDYEDDDEHFNYEDDDDDEQLELRFYDGLDGDFGYGWPVDHDHGWPASP